MSLFKKEPLATEQYLEKRDSARVSYMSKRKQATRKALEQPRTSQSIARFQLKELLSSHTNPRSVTLALFPILMTNTSISKVKLITPDVQSLMVER